MQNIHCVKMCHGSPTELICVHQTAQLLSVNAGTRRISHSKQSQAETLASAKEAGQFLSEETLTALMPSQELAEKKKTFLKHVRNNSHVLL